MPRRLAAFAALLALSLGCAGPIALSREARASRQLASLRGDPSLQADFLRQMPKGGDLHLHLSGAVYAESYLRWAEEDGLCVRRDPLGLVTECDAARGDLPTADALRADGGLYDAMVNALSMRAHDPSGPPGHDHFFAAFDRFDARRSRDGDALAEVLSRLARQNTWYVEVMQSFGVGSVASLGANAPWGADLGPAVAAIDAARVTAWVQRARARIDDQERRARELLRCGRPDEDPGCQVTARYLVAPLRTMGPGEVLAQMVAATALVEADPRAVGLNLVAPEDHPLARRHYSEHMRAVAFVTRRGERVPVSLHAGELSPSLVPPEDAAFHVAEAVRVAGARRIGHGSDIAWERDASGTLAEMARRGVAIEHCLSSASLILGLHGRDYPLELYRRAGVPQVLATDDEGVARSDLTREYLRAVTVWGLSYTDLKRMARDALERSFLPGASVWAGRVGLRRAECVSDWASAACVRALVGSERARAQARLEAEFQRFEARW